MSTTQFIYKADELISLGERYPSRKIVIETDCSDLDVFEIFEVFKSFVLSCGYAEKSFYDACKEFAQQAPTNRSGDRHELEQPKQQEIWHSGGYDYNSQENASKI